MSSRFPEFVDPWRLAERGERFSGQLELRQMPRLVEVLASLEGKASFELEFASDERRRPRIRGLIKADLVLRCQRCLELVRYLVSARLDLSVIEVLDEIARLPAEAEPVLATDGLIRLAEVLEEELLLAVPQVPRHDQPGCTIGEGKPDQQGTVREDNPFEVLSVLKKPEKD